MICKIIRKWVPSAFLELRVKPLGNPLVSWCEDLLFVAKIPLNAHLP